jgi:hypothetical protein
MILTEVPRSILSQTCQIDLVKENSHVYFINILASSDAPVEQRVTSAYVISLILYKNPFGQVLDFCDLFE